MFKALSQKLGGTLTATFDRHFTIEDFTEMGRNTRIFNETRVIVLVQAMALFFRSRHSKVLPVFLECKYILEK